MILSRNASRTLAVAIFAFVGVANAAKTPIDQALYDTFVRYTRFSAAAYASQCPDPPGSAVVAHFVDEKTTDTQAFILRDKSANELILSFRGTSSIQDLGTDLDQLLAPYVSPGVSCAECSVHQGYLGQWNSVASEILSTVQEELGADEKLTVTGHSMGAALAALASVSLKGQGYNLTTYTFGQPRTGNPAFANLVDTILPQGVMFRVTHSNDGVPQAVDRKQGYQHHKTEYWANDPPSAQNTVMCEGDEPPDCNNSVDGIGIGGFNGRGINAAHLNYFGISIGNPLDGGASECM